MTFWKRQNYGDSKKISDSGIENRLVVAKGKAGEGGMDWELGIADANYYTWNG